MDEKNYRWYKVPVTTEALDGKKIKEEYMVKATSLSDIEEQVATYMKDSTLEYTTDGAQATKIIDIIGYQEGSKD